MDLGTHSDEDNVPLGSFTEKAESSFGLRAYKPVYLLWPHMGVTSLSKQPFGEEPSEGELVS